jgi:hypothetical protein
MNAIKKARKLIETKPESLQAQLISKLVLSLESESTISLSELYQLDIKHFDLAIEILKEWRLDRYYLGKAKLFNVSIQANELPPAP